LKNAARPIAAARRLAQALAAVGYGFGTTQILRTTPSWLTSPGTP
jgi:hypothetical protein